MSFGDLYTVQPGQDDPNLPPIELPKVERKPPGIRLTTGAPFPQKSEAEKYGFSEGLPPVQGEAPKRAAASAEDRMPPEFAEGLPPPPEEKEPYRDIGRGEAVSRGLIGGSTFGASPAIGGLQAAGLDWLPKDVQKLFEGHEHEPAIGAIMSGLVRLGYEQFTGEKGGKEAYRKRRDELQEAQDQAFKQQPAAFIAGEIPPALAMPMGATRGATMGPRIAAQTIGGTIQGGLNEAGSSVSRGEGLADTLTNVGKGAGTGGMFGVAGGLVSEAAGGAVQRVASILRGARDPDQEAARRIVQAGLREYERTGQMPITPEMRQAAQQAGVPLSLLDELGESGRALGGSVKVTSPEGRAAIQEVTGDRFLTQSTRLGNFIERMTGTGGSDAAGDVETIQAAARRANRPAYNRAYAAGDRPIGHEAVFQRLMGAPAVRAAMRGAIERGQNRAVADGFGAFNPGVRVTQDGNLIFDRGRSGVPTYPNLQFWDYVQRELRDMGTAASRAGRNEEAGAIGSLHTQLREALDHAVPEFAQARMGASRFFGAEDALEAGRNFVMQNADMGEARRAIARMTPPERQLFRRGFAYDLVNKIRSTPDSANVINNAFLNSETARRKIDMALGTREANQIEALLRVEALAQQGYRVMNTGSPTAQLIAEHGLAGGIGAGGVGAIELAREHDYNPWHLAQAFLAGAAIRGTAHHIDQNVARRVGEMLASHDPTVFQRGIQVVANSRPMLDALRATTAAGANIGERHIGPENAAAGAATLGMRALEGPAEHPDEHHNPVSPDDYYGNQ